MCAPVTVAVDQPGEVQQAGLDGALALWRTQGVTTLRIAEEDGAPDEIALRFTPAARQFYGLYDDEAGVVYINSTIADPTPLAVVIAHELGHAFGLPHVPPVERRSLMNPGNFVTPPTDEDRAAIEALWGRCGDEPR